MLRRTIAFFGFALLACGDSTGPNVSGTVSFSFVGAGGGSFNVAAVAPNTGEEPDASKSLTAGISNDTVTFGAAFKARGGGFGDAVAFALNRAVVGSAPVTADCDPEGTTACAGLIFVINFDTEGETMDYRCTLTSGTVSITEISNSRIVGTFSGSGECLNAQEVTSPFTVTGGTFNVFRLSATAIE